MKKVFLLALLGWVVTGFAMRWPHECGNGLVRFSADSGGTASGYIPVIRSGPEAMKLIAADQSGDYWYLARGVAPAEADATLNNGLGEADGRVPGRNYYGVADRSKPCYLINNVPATLAIPPAQIEDYLEKRVDPLLAMLTPNAAKEAESDLNPRTLEKIWSGMKMYADQGAAAERVGTEHPHLAPTDRIRWIYLHQHARGKILIFRVPKSVVLEWHPESRAPASERVFGMPEKAELIALFDTPVSVDRKTGLPQF